MKKIELVQLFKVFESVKTFGEIKFKYAILKNLKIINDEIEVLKNIEVSIEEVMQPVYEQRNEIIKKLGNANEDGNISIDVNDVEVISEFNKEMQIILDENKDTVQKYNEEMVKYNEILNEEIEVLPVFHKIDIDICPNDLDVNVLDLFMKCGIVD